MNFAALKAELTARGFDYLSTTRQGYLINAGRAELDRMNLWPWRETSVTGTAPLTITDLGTIETVIDTSLTLSPPLVKAEYRYLLDLYGDLSTTGTPNYYYLSRPSSPEVATYPTSSTDIIGVQYWKVTPDLSADADVPLSPAEAHLTIVDLAVRRAYRDSDDHAAAEAIQSEIDRAVNQLLIQYPPGYGDGPDYQQVITQDY